MEIFIVLHLLDFALTLPLLRFVASCICDKPSLVVNHPAETNALRFLRLHNSIACQSLDECRQGRPARSIHVNMILVGNVFIVSRWKHAHKKIHSVGTHLPIHITRLKNAQIPVLKLGKTGLQPTYSARVLSNDLSRILSKETHIAKMRLGALVALHAILVSTLLLTDLTIPSKLLKSLRLPVRTAQLPHLHPFGYSLRSRQVRHD